MMIIRRFVSITCAGVGLVIAVGCRSDRTGKGHHDAAGTTMVTSAEVRTMLDTANDRIARARCQREVACDHVGPTKPHTSVETCVALMKSEIAKELKPESCPYGPDEMNVADCIAAAERTSCLDPIGALLVVEDCRVGKLCSKKAL